MKKLFVTLTLILTLCSANLSHAADRYVMLKIDGTTNQASHSVGAGEVAFLLWGTHISGIGTTAAKVDVTYGGITRQIGPNGGADNWQFGDKHIIPGPAVIIYSSSTSRSEFMAIKISPNPNIMGIKQ